MAQAQVESGAPDQPDLMNDPQYATNTGDEGNGEPDTCRICRGEATATEALFYPCKCSGSIKFVHQDCLMEWLSHSQKKHCELCKTPFRFTKLYAPDMPQSLPTLVFLQHLFIHTIRNLTTWMRFGLVVMVWIGWLPWTMRQVWGFLFWFGDGGWNPARVLVDSDLISDQAVENVRAAFRALNGNGTSPVTPLLSEPTSAALITDILNVPRMFFARSNLTETISLTASILRAFTGAPINENATTLFNQTVEPMRRPTLLSDVEFLKHLTRHPSLNKIIISTLEGQIITILVVVCFILVFLIREWVVQQQPGLNMGNGFNPDFARAEPIQEAVAEVVAPADEEVEPIAEAQIRPNLGPDGERMMARPRRRVVHFDHQNPTDADDAAQDQDGLPTTRPQMHAMSSAVEVQRRLTEDTSTGATDVTQFLNMWRRAEGRPEEVLRIMEEEGLTEKMQYWANAMTKQAILAQNQNQNQNARSYYSDDDWRPVIVDEIDRIRANEARERAEARNREHKYGGGSIPEEPAPWNRPSRSDDSSADAPSQTAPLFNFDGAKETSKGKEKAAASAEPTFDMNGPLPGLLEIGGSGTRPRAISDGPQLKEKSPLANDNWSFPRFATEDRPLDSAANSSPWRFNFDEDIKAPSSPRPSQVEFPALEAEESATSADLHPDQQQAPSPPRSPLLPATEAHEETEQVDIPPPPAAIPEPAAAPQTMLGRMTDFLWGDVAGNAAVEEVGANDEHVVQDLAAEPPFVPVAQGRVALGQENDDRDAAAAALAAGIDPNDQDALDDAEDFEGIMELIGMRGPLTGLVQNGMFSAVLISLTVACGVWIPYNIGRFVLLLVANPIPTVKLPLKLMFSLAAFIQDMSLLLLGGATWLFLSLFSMFTSQPPTVESVSQKLATEAVNATLSTKAWSMTISAGDRITWSIFHFLQTIVESEIPAFSAISHEALLGIKATIASAIGGSFSTIGLLLTQPISDTLTSSVAISSQIYQLLIDTSHHLSALLSLPFKSGPWVLSLDIVPRQVPLDPALTHWTGGDRFWAILTGYATLSMLGSLYLRKGMPFSRTAAGREWETALIDMLHQAGGVMKVILIISIEMLVFPLYCGLLLDVALLPLFEDVTIASRFAFTMNSPLTSIFVHWFVGTCYMFHFALFVSMCRKIMRPGVLYFIRDPDDPTFHPVRDVLDRNVATQLRKITFSALVYGALVVICLGGVVWGLSFTFTGVLPIHWSSNEPVLEFPIDLLFYNFFMPLAVRFFKPSDGLHAMYRWWFRKCARILRLTWFLFDTRERDEEGRHITRSWIDMFRGLKGDLDKPMSPKDAPFQDEKLDVYFCPDGQYVRCPASDQVRIPKGTRVFLEVDEGNNRVDEEPDRPNGLHGRDSKQFTMVYIPPHFRQRIFLFILFIWLFAAATGVCITIVPLVFGRKIFAQVIPNYIAKNDIYAFSIGIYIIGSVLYCAIHLRQGLEWIQERSQAAVKTPMKVARRMSDATLYFLCLAYVYVAIGFVVPVLSAMVVEFYFIIPLHTYFGGSERHVVHFVQSWTLGLLYVKLSTRFILWYQHSRPARALRSITRDGYLNPDVRLATRAFIIPAVVVLTSALVTPLPFAWVMTKSGMFTQSSGIQNLERVIYRYAYPIFLSLCINLVGIYALVGMLKGWKQRVRDEVYLIGERLHNFGERKSSSSIQGVARSTRIET